MGICGSRSNVPNVPRAESEMTQSAQPTSIPTSTPSPKPSTTANTRSRTKAKDRRDDAPDRRKKNSRKRPPSKTTPTQRTGSASMDVAASSSAPSGSGSAGRTTGMTSTAVLGSGNQRVGTQPMPGLSSETRPRFPFTLQSLLSNDFRFRILVVGKRDSGKSSLVKAVFDVDMSGSPTNISGKTAEFCPRDNRHLIVHECSASGRGEMQAIRDFITTRNHKSRPVSERLHAIWICIPMSDLIHGQADEGVKMLLDTGVPFVIVFTKVDLSSSHNDYEGRCRALFGDVPADIVSTQPKFRHLINKLVATTDGVIIAHSHGISAPSGVQRTQPRLSPVSLAWSVSQRASRDINVQAAIEVGRSRYWRQLWSSDDFAGQTLANCIEIIHADIVGTWNFPDKDKYFSSPVFKAKISYLVQDLSGHPISTSSKHRLGSTPEIGAAWLNGRYENSKENICLVVGYIVDLILVLCRVFSSTSNVSPGEVQSVINNFASSSLKATIHNDISGFIKTVPQFEYHDNDIIMAKIRDLISRNCDSPPGNVTHK